MLNTVVLMGRLTRDPELRYTQNQTAVASLNLAVDRDIVPHNDTAVKADFIPLTAWAKQAEFADKYLRKGMLLVVKGSLQVRNWTGKDEVKRSTPDVLVDKFYFAESKGAKSASVVSAEDFEELDDDAGGALPF